MIRCPKCKSNSLRIHGSQFELGWGRSLLSRDYRPKTKVVAVECSCADCLHAFISRPDGVEDAPVQIARDGLTRDLALGKGRTSQGAEEAKVVPLPRPAPDPRVRRN